MHPTTARLLRAAVLAACLVHATAAVVVRPGESIQAAVDAHPAGTAFTIAAGLHRGQRVVPKTGDAFIGEPGAVLHGGDAVDYAFLGDVAARPADVRIQGLVIERYAPPLHFGAIRAGGHGTGEGGAGWVVEDCEIRFNRHAAIRTGDRMRVLRCHLHHNGWNGLIGTGDGMLIEGNEIAWNNTARLVDGGAGKLVVTRGLVVRGNFSHHNHGPGIWTDINNIDTLYEANVIEDNEHAGIFHEISYRAVIRGNFIARNGAQAPWLFGAGVLVSESPDVEVHGNVLIDNRCGIIGKQQVRGEPALHGPHVLERMRVHRNVTRQAAGHIAGIGQDVADGASYFTSRGNRFDANAYHLGSLASPFHWSDPWSTPEEWRGYGNDADGTFVRTAQADIAAPIAALTRPSSGATLSGAVELVALARDDVAVVAVRFAVDGVVVGEATAPPWRIAWDASSVAPGPHALTAIARDAAGRTATSPAASVVTAGRGAPSADAQVWLSDLAPASATSGWGPWEKDRSNGERGAADGRPLTLDGVAYAKGLGVHASADLRWALAGAYESFACDVGIDDEVGANGSVSFQVWVDGALRADSGVLRGADARRALAVDCPGARELRLVVTDAGDGAAYDHADWAGARLTRAAATGSIRREWWTGVAGSRVADLLADPRFPASPSGSDLLASFAAPGDWADRYGTCVRGFLHPPVTGDYVLWLSGDDECELWLSGDADPAGRRLVACVPGWTRPGDWTKYPQQRSAPVRLEAGRRYCVEAWQKEEGGGDGVMVGWTLPDGAHERPIPGSRLSPATGPATRPPVDAGTGLTGEYRDDPAGGVSLTRLDGVVDFDWGLGSPDPALGADAFAVAWTGYVEPRFSEEYAFHVTADDGVRLWIDGRLVIDRWVDQAASECVGTATLTAGWPHAIRLEYYENGGHAVARLAWSSARQARETVPRGRLFPAGPAGIGRAARGGRPGG